MSSAVTVEMRRAVDELLLRLIDEAPRRRREIDPIVQDSSIPDLPKQVCTLTWRRLAMLKERGLIEFRGSKYYGRWHATKRNAPVSKVNENGA